MNNLFTPKYNWITENKAIDFVKNDFAVSCGVAYSRIKEVHTLIDI